MNSQGKNAEVQRVQSKANRQKLVVEEHLFDLTLTGNVCLDFANTVDWRSSKMPKELLNSYADLVRWALHTKILTPHVADELVQRANHNKSDAVEVLERAK